MGSAYRFSRHSSNEDEMKLNLRALAFVGLTFVMTAPAQALTIVYPTSGVLNDTRWEGTCYNPNNNNVTSCGQSAIDAIILPLIAPAVELYKADVGLADSGILKDSYATTFSNTASDPQDALIKYSAGNYVGPIAYALVKDGAQSPGWYLFNLTALNWDGKEDLSFQGFWPNQGAISHVTLYGTSASPDPAPVPDGGSVAMLLGMGLMGIAAARRMLS
jgi:hypothetical protein